MSIRVSVSVAVFLLLAVGVLGCGDGNSTVTPTGPTGLAATTAATSALAVEPLVLSPQFFPGAACGGFQPFGLGFRVIVAPSSRGRFVNGVSFSFVDRRGVRVVPFATAGTFEGGIMSTGVPSAGPILVPGQVSSIFFIYPSTRAAMPFLLRIDCGFAPSGLLSIGVDMTDQIGNPSRAQFAVTVGR